MKNSNKTNKIIILGIIGLILTVAIVVFVLNYTKDDFSFSLLEKNWISSNSNKVIDVSIYNDIPIYEENGEGISFSFLKNITDTYGIDFNKVSYLSNNNSNLKDFSFRIVDYNTELSDKDILMYNDYYVIASKEKTVINDLSDIKGINLGVLTEDVNSVKYYLNDSEEITYVACTDMKEMISKLSEDKISYIAIPGNMHIDDILENDLNIVYHISELYKKYVMTINNNTFRNIVNKIWMMYQNNNELIDYKKYFLNTFFNYKELSEAEKMSYNATSYIYGYVPNMPFENAINNEFVGTLSNYLSGFEDLANVDFKIVGYSSVAELKQALSYGEVDLIFGNFNPTGVNVDILETTSPFKEEYVILSKENYIVNSIRSLKGNKVYTVKNTYLYNYLVENGITVNGFNNTDDLLKNINNDSIVAIDQDTYKYYKDTKFKNFKIDYTGILNNDYKFLIRDVNKNNTFYQLFSYYVANVNYKSIMYKYNTDYMINSKNQFSIMLKYLVAILFIISFVFLSLFVMVRKKSKKENLNKEDKLKFIDVMTSLKNRNYLNYNIAKWDENVIYPQTIVIIDLNNIKYINDNYGHEEGDITIKSAANILLNSQMENTDIMRTDGNEFLIYMVGYDEKKVQDYTRTLNRNLKELPHGFGATIGYSMITDDIKTIDDAINEATLSMRQAKERL